MATRIRADRNIVDHPRKARAKKEAEAAFKTETETSGDDEGDGDDKVVHIANMASPSDARRFESLLEAEEAEYAKAKADAAAKVKRAKQKLDKLYADAVDVLKSQGVTKKTLQEHLKQKKRSPEEVAAEAKASIWLMRASNMPLGAQLVMFDEPVEDEKAARNKAREAGRSAHSAGEGTQMNPYAGHQYLSQEWLEGWHEAETAVIQQMSNNAGADSSDDTEDAGS